MTPEQSARERAQAEERARELCLTQGPQTVWLAWQWIVTSYRKGDENRPGFAGMYTKRDTSKRISLGKIMMEHDA